MKLGNNLDVNRYQLLNVVIDNEAAAPGTPVGGQMYYDTVDHLLWFYNGTSWFELVPSDPTFSPRFDNVTLNGAANVDGLVLLNADSVGDINCGSISCQPQIVPFVGSVGTGHLYAKFFVDHGDVLAADISNRTLYGTNGTTAMMNWNSTSAVTIPTAALSMQSGAIFMGSGVHINNTGFLDSSSRESVHAQNRLLVDTSGDTAVDWQNRFLYGSDGFTQMVSWEGVDVVTMPNVDLELGGGLFVGDQIYDQNNLASINPTVRTLIDSAGAAVVLWDDTNLSNVQIATGLSMTGGTGIFMNGNSLSMGNADIFGISTLFTGAIWDQNASHELIDCTLGAPSSMTGYVNFDTSNNVYMPGLVFAGNNIPSSLTGNEATLNVTNAAGSWASNIRLTRSGTDYDARIALAGDGMIFKRFDTDGSVMFSFRDFNDTHFWDMYPGGFNTFNGTSNDGVTCVQIGDYGSGSLRADGKVTIGSGAGAIVLDPTSFPGFGLITSTYMLPGAILASDTSYVMDVNGVASSGRTLFAALRGDGSDPRLMIDFSGGESGGGCGPTIYGSVNDASLPYMRFGDDGFSGIGVYFPFFDTAHHKSVDVANRILYASDGSTQIFNWNSATTAKASLASLVPAVPVDTFAYTFSGGL